MEPLKDKRICIGVTGGIAIYKVLDVISRLKKKGAILDIIMTEAATKLVSPITFQTMGRCVVHTQMFQNVQDYHVEHIELASRCDLMLIAPATANTMAKAVHGIADNLLTTTLLATQAPVVFATAMNTNMLQHPATVKNMDALKALGYHFISSNSGMLACNTYGDGRMAEPIEIIDALEKILSPKDLCNKKIIVTGGPTVERIDPVRYISNDSSGKMGYELARAARNRGAKVTMVLGPNHLPPLQGVKTVHITSNDEMFEAIKEDFDRADALIMAAAPADFKVSHTAKQKIKKSEQFTLELEKNKDLIAYFGENKTNQVIIGFCAETENLIDHAKDKMTRKHMDAIVANDVTIEGAGFHYDTNIATILTSEKVTPYPIMSKFYLANVILDLIKDKE